MAILRKRSLVMAAHLLEAWWRFFEVSDNQLHFEEYVMHPGLLNKIVGDTHTYIDVPDETARRIEMLLGPHYKAVIKAWYIRRDATP